MFNNSFNIQAGFSSNENFRSAVTGIPTSYGSNYIPSAPQNVAPPPAPNYVINCHGMSDYTVHLPEVCSTLHSDYPSKVLESTMKGIVYGVSMGAATNALTAVPVPHAAAIGAKLGLIGGVLDGVMSNSQSLYDTTYQHWDGTTPDSTLLGSGNLFK